MEISTVNLLIIIGGVVVFLALIILALAKQYRKAGPNEVLIISGGRMRKVTDADGTVRKIGYRMNIGGGTFVKPFTVYGICTGFYRGSDQWMGPNPLAMSSGTCSMR